nr:hypothetical protein CFP56_32879 [Quercus suber]
MEEVENLWRKLSLSKEEEVGLEVLKLLGVTKSLLTGKFLTHCMVNKEAVFKTFKPLWRTRKPFLIHDMSENKMVFEFENEVDLEWVMEFEPWTYDKHLVLFQRINGVAAWEMTSLEPRQPSPIRELGLPEDYVAPPLVSSLEVVLNAKSNPTKKLPVDKISGSAIFEINLLNFVSGLNKENGPNPMAASSTENMRPLLVDISNTSGLKGTPQDKTPVVEGSERSNSDALQPVEEARGPSSGMFGLSL